MVTMEMQVTFKMHTFHLTKTEAQSFQPQT